ncbi:hypothetical protein V2J09_015549 [Rumex salicifolius]
MASSSSTSHHTRSNSLPSISNTVVSELDEQINSCSTSTSINNKLTHLSNLYKCIDEFLQLPSSRKALSCQDECIEDSLEGSIKLLDICTNISDVLVQMKERVQELQSILRRRCSEDEIAAEVAKYLRSRRMAIKTLSRELKNLKKVDNKYVVENNDVISRLNECQMVTLDVLESVLVTIVGPQRSVVSKLLKSKRVEVESFLVGFEAKHANLSSLENMEISIGDVEQGIENLFRHLIKTRTTILNILNC